MSTDTSTNTPSTRAGAIAADLYDRIALDRDGQPFRDDDPDTWDEAEAAEPKIVSLGQVRLRVLEDRDAEVIARAAGAITDDGPPVFCLIAELDVKCQQVLSRNRYTGDWSSQVDTVVGAVPVVEVIPQGQGRTALV